MLENGSVILEHQDFVEDMNTVQCWDGDDGWLLNIVHRSIYGFNALAIHTREETPCEEYG